MGVQERLSQQLRAAALARGAGSAAGWVERVKAMAAALAAPRYGADRVAMRPRRCGEQNWATEESKEMK